MARALIAAVYERARELGLPRVYWNTHETNQTAMRLYDKVAERPGFVMYRKVLTPGERKRAPNGARRAA